MAVNDITIIIGISVVFILFGTFLPLIEHDFSGEELTNTDIDGLQDDLSEGVGEDRGNTLSIWKIIWSIISMFFWSFGTIPWWLDGTVILAMRITLVLTLARNIWVGGGN